MYARFSSYRVFRGGILTMQPQPGMAESAPAPSEASVGVAALRPSRSVALLARLGHVLKHCGHRAVVIGAATSTLALVVCWLVLPLQPRPGVRWDEPVRSISARSVRKSATLSAVRLAMTRRSASRPAWT
jgi:hypothetical protein